MLTVEKRTGTRLAVTGWITHSHIHLTTLNLAVGNVIINLNGKPNQNQSINTHLTENLLRYGHQQMNAEEMVIPKNVFLYVAMVSIKHIRAIYGVISHYSPF